MADMVTRELCDQKHAELMRAVAELRTAIMRVVTVMEGNGRPGFRETQADLERLKEKQASDLKTIWREVAQEREKAARDMAEVRARRDNWLFFVLRPILPLLYGALFAGVYVSLS